MKFEKNNSRLNETAMKSGTDKRKIPIVLLVVCIIIAMVLYFVLINGAKAELEVEKVPMVVATQSIQTGQKISKETFNQLFKVVEYEKSTYVDGSLSSIESVLALLSGGDDELIANKDIVSNSIILINDFRSENEKEDFSGYSEIGMSVSSFSDAVGGSIRAGDRIDIYFTDKENNITAFENVYVNSALSGAGICIDTTDEESITLSFNVFIKTICIKDFVEKLNNCDVKIAIKY